MLVRRAYNRAPVLSAVPSSFLPVMFEVLRRRRAAVETPRELVRRLATVVELRLVIVRERNRAARIELGQHRAVGLTGAVAVGQRPNLGNGLERPRAEEPINRSEERRVGKECRCRWAVSV